MSRAKKIGIGVCAALVAALIVCGVAAGAYYKSIMDKLSPDDDKQITQVTEASDGEPYYVLILGGDSREDSEEDNRSDSMMVARVDEANQQVSLLSVPRDLRVNMGEHGYQKINAAIEFGGYDYAIELVNELLDIQINYYAFIYFSGFEDLVDELGGVTVDVPEGTYYNGVWVEAGEDVEINGEEALVLARCRHGYPPDTGAYVMGDYQRTMNQRNLVKAIAKKVLASDTTELPSLVSSLAECLETNMGTERLVSLVQNMKGMDVDNMETSQLPIAGATIDGAWCAVLYEDVFEVMKANFTSGNALDCGLGNFDDTHDGDNVGYSYVDGDLYSYTSYEDLYGDFRSYDDGFDFDSIETLSMASYDDSYDDYDDGDYD